MNLENVYIKRFILILLFGLFTNLIYCISPIIDSTNDTIVWTNIKELEVEGRGWKESSLFYGRLPAKAEKTVPPGVWNLSEHTAGMYVRFITDATIIKASSRTGKPIVFYGTSITQGGCASRPGMCTTAILGRRLDMEIINLGFSGSGRMEPALAELLAELDPLIYFIDCLPNLQADEVATRVEPFVQILRKARPDIPIVLVEGVTYDDAFLRETRYLRNSQSRIALRNAYENLLNSGVRHLFYQVAEGQLGFDGEGTVDGTHPTDLGFMRQADVYQPLLENIIREEMSE